MVPEYLFHATYLAYLESVLQHGLGGGDKLPPKNYEDSKAGVVYLATTSEIASSYAESAETVVDDWVDEIVVLRVPVAALTLNKLFKDQNVQLEPQETPDTFEYHGIIPPELLAIVG